MIKNTTIRNMLEGRTKKNRHTAEKWINEFIEKGVLPLSSNEDMNEALETTSNLMYFPKRNTFIYYIEGEFFDVEDLRGDSFWEAVEVIFERKTGGKK